MKTSLKVLFSIALLFVLFLLPLTVFAAGDPPAVTTDAVRVTLLSDSVIRVEAATNGGFEDRATLLAAGRADFFGVRAEIREDEDTITAVTDTYRVVVRKGVALTDDAVSVYNPNGKLLWTYSSGMDQDALLRASEITSSSVIYYNYPSGAGANDGLTPETAKQGWGGTTGVAAAISGGGTLVFSGRGYVGANYTLPVLSSPLKITGKYGDRDFRQIASAANDCTGSFSLKAGATFALQSDAVFDDVLLLSTGASASTIRVKGGAKVVFEEGVESVLLNDACTHLALEIDADSTVILKGGVFSAIRGGGTLAVTDAVAALLDDALLAGFTGHIVFTDGSSLCTAYTRHTPNADGVCTVCGKSETEIPYVPTNGFYTALPAPAETPEIFVLADEPRVIPAAAGMAYIGSTDTYSDWVRRDGTDLYLFLPTDAISFRSDFVTLTGKTPIPNIKTLGSWYSRYQDWTDEEYLAVIDNYRANNFPLDVLVVDTRWRAGEDGTGYDIDETCFPDMQRYLATAKEKGVLSIFNDHTHKTSDQMLLPAELEHHTTNLQGILDMGLDGWWYDRNWSYGLKSPYAEITGATLGKVMYYDIMAAYNPDRRVFLMANADWDRNGTIESAPSVIGHRYGIQWTGDITSEALQLREELTNMLYSSTAGGSPYISSDLGGFKRATQQSEEMYTRWMQYGALSPIFRIHSTMSSSAEINKLPYTYSEGTQTIVRKYMNLRYNLLPLFYTLAYENYETGMPLCRTPDFYDPEFPQAADNTEYLLGTDLLVAPLWSAYGEGDDIVPASWFADGLQVNYYNNKTLSGTPVYTGTVPNIDFEWLNGSPAAGVNSDSFSGVYTGTITPAEDCYLGAVADDGVRIYLDGELFVDGWTAGWLVSHMNMETPLCAGNTYDIRVEYYDGSGGAACRLVYAHITEPGISARDVFFPSGSWIDLFSGTTYSEETARVYHGVETTPLFVRRGAVIPSAEPISPIPSADYRKLSLQVFAGGDGTYTLYEDDGVSLGYANGNFRKTAITHTADADGGRLEIAAAVGAFTTDYTARTLTVRIHSDRAVTSVTVNGNAVGVKKIPADPSAFPLAESGGAPDGDVYEVTFQASLEAANILTYSYTEVVDDPLLRSDFNGDGSVSVADALYLLRAILNKTPIAGDLNGDGAINFLDILWILKHISE